MDFEQTTIAFTTMLGSSERAIEMLGKLSEFAAKTPFQLAEVEEGAKQLLAMGASVESVIPELKMLGDVSAGLNVPMSRLILNFGQVRVQGKLTGRELRDFAIAGVPLIDELAKSLGVAKEEIAGMVEKGAITFDMVSTAFQNMTSEGGRFNDLMQAQSETTAGKFSNLKDEVSLLARELGQNLLPAAKGALEAVIPFVKNLGDAAELTNDFHDSIELLAGIGLDRDLANALLNSQHLTDDFKQSIIDTASSIKVELLGALSQVSSNEVWDDIENNMVGTFDEAVKKVDSLNLSMDSIKSAMQGRFAEAWKKWREVLEGGAEAWGENNEELIKAGLNIKEVTSDIIFQTASMGLNEEATLALARSMGLLSEIDYTIINATRLLREEYDMQDGVLDGVIQNTEGYSKAVNDLSEDVMNAPDQKTIQIIVDKALADARLSTLVSDLNRLTGRTWTAAVDIVLTGVGLSDIGKNIANVASNVVKKKKASGGDVARGEAYIVGEKRPELFVPSQNGRIIPRVPNVGGGAATVVVQFNSTMPPDRDEAERVLVPLIERSVNKMIEQSRQ